MMHRTLPADSWSMGKVYPGTSGITITARHSWPEWCAWMMRDTRASPILFVMEVPSTSQLVEKNWFSMYL